VTDFAPSGTVVAFPQWVPRAVQNYIFHTESGLSIRRLAKSAGCHASTVMRQVRKIESRRDDLLIDEALDRLASVAPLPAPPFEPATKDGPIMTMPMRFPNTTPDDETVDREARRILRRLCEPAAVLAVARDMEKAVVVREADDGRTTRTAVVDRPIAQAMALKDWITCEVQGRISRYRITGTGRAALKRLLADTQAARAGFAEAPAHFGVNPRLSDTPDSAVCAPGTHTNVRYTCIESPVTSMARRRDKDGQPFLSPDLVSAAERLREDFEVAQMGTRVTQNWEKFLAVGEGHTTSGDANAGDGPTRARNRVSEALAALGPGLGDVVLRVCCFLEGLEAAEKRMGWSARSGKIVLRIALQRLKQHYVGNRNGAMIG